MFTIPCRESGSRGHSGPWQPAEGGLVPRGLTSEGSWRDPSPGPTDLPRHWAQQTGQKAGPKPRVRRSMGPMQARGEIRARRLEGQIWSHNKGVTRSHITSGLNLSNSGVKRRLFDVGHVAGEPATIVAMMKILLATPARSTSPTNADESVAGCGRFSAQPSVRSSTFGAPAVAQASKGGPHACAQTPPPTASCTPAPRRRTKPCLGVARWMERPTARCRSSGAPPAHVWPPRLIKAGRAAGRAPAPRRRRARAAPRSSPGGVGPPPPLAFGGRRLRDAPAEVDHGAVCKRPSRGTAARALPRRLVGYVSHPRP